VTMTGTDVRSLGRLRQSFEHRLINYVIVNSFANKCVDVEGGRENGKEKVVSVGERVTSKEVEIWDQSSTKDRRVWFAVDEEVGEPTAEPTKQDRRAPIKILGGRAWSPGIYQALRLLGKSLDVAWEKAFIHPLTLIYNLQLLSYTRAHCADSMADASINMLHQHYLLIACVLPCLSSAEKTCGRPNPRLRQPRNSVGP
jgi:hypothetical protein